MFNIKFISSEDPEEIQTLTKGVYSTIYPERDDYPIAKGDIKNLLIVAEDQLNEVIGAISGAIYSNRFCSRKDNWYFGENRKRSFWIEFLVSKQKGLGTELIKQVHKWFDQNQDLAIKKNYYVTAVPNAYGFYQKMGYVEIMTPSHEDDADCPNVFREEYDCIHMAKPIGHGTQLHEEKLFVEGMTDLQLLEHYCKRGDSRITDMISDIPKLIKQAKGEALEGGNSSDKYSYEEHLFVKCVASFDLTTCQKILQALGEDNNHTEEPYELIKNSEYSDEEWIQFALRNRYTEVYYWLNIILST